MDERPSPPSKPVKYLTISAHNQSLLAPPTKNAPLRLKKPLILLNCRVLIDFLGLETITVAVTLRLARYGVRKNAFYRFVALEKASKRNGGVIENLGTYNPMVEPPVINIKEDRVRRWIEVGAQVSGVARDLIIKKLPGLIEKREEHQRKKIQAARKARKARLAGKGTKKAKK